MMVVFGQSEYMSRDNDVTIVLARNRISAAPCSAFSFEMLYATYSLDECLLLCEISKKTIMGISRYLGIFHKKGINYACPEVCASCRKICYFWDVSEKI